MVALSEEAPAVAFTPIPGSWFGFPIEVNQVSHPSSVGELLPGSCEKNETLAPSIFQACSRSSLRNQADWPLGEASSSSVRMTEYASTIPQ